MCDFSCIGLLLPIFVLSTGMDMQNVRFLWASDEINAHAEEYWSLVMDVARVNNLPRIQRCCTIMGRKDTEEMSAAQIFYPCMQCADVFFLKVRASTTFLIFFLDFQYSQTPTAVGQSCVCIFFIFVYVRFLFSFTNIMFYLFYRPISASWVWTRERSTC